MVPPRDPGSSDAPTIAMPDGSIDVRDPEGAVAAMSAARRASLDQLFKQMDLDGNGSTPRAAAASARRSSLRTVRAQEPRAPCAQANEPRLRWRQLSTKKNSSLR